VEILTRQFNNGTLLANETVRSANGVQKAYTNRVQVIVLRCQYEIMRLVPVPVPRYLLTSVSDPDPDWIRIQSGPWIRIRFQGQESEEDTQLRVMILRKLTLVDPDPDSPNLLDPDSLNPDPKHCSLQGAKCELGSGSFKLKI